VLSTEYRGKKAWAKKSICVVFFRAAEQTRRRNACSFVTTVSNGADDGCSVPSLFFVDDEVDISREENKMENEGDQDFNHPWNI
jgi:hypothetical protein